MNTFYTEAVKIKTLTHGKFVNKKPSLQRKWVVLLNIVHCPSNISPTLLQTKARAISSIMSFYNKIFPPYCSSKALCDCPGWSFQLYTGLSPLTSPASLPSFSAWSTPVFSLWGICTCCSFWLGSSSPASCTASALSFLSALKSSPQKLSLDHSLHPPCNPYFSTYFFHNTYCNS